MGKIIKTIVTFTLFIAVIPALAGLAITALWNSILVPVCGFAVIGFWYSVGLFLLGQIMTGSFIIALFIIGGCLHKILHHDNDWHSHWHNMTDEQRRKFIEVRRRAHFSFRNHNTNTDAAE
ncbi:MAG: hypothetical protein K2G33_01200 [Duncaniella sp.]|nr:hypothetical protein [Duncaniella sp.]MDE6116108.1 hypothetical protein [Duncaniella sp.]